MAQRHVVGLLQYIYLGLSQVLRDGAETIAGAVKSRKARKLRPPRKQRLPQIRCKRWRHDDAPRAVARDDKHAAHVAAPQWSDAVAAPRGCC